MTQEHTELTLQTCPGSDSLLRDGSFVAAIVNPKYASRLAACWTACRGINQKSLEENGVASFESVVALREYELLTALKHVMNRLVDEHETDESAIKARAVIAKAEALNKPKD